MFFIQVQTYVFGEVKNTETFTTRTKISILVCSNLSMARKIKRFFQMCLKTNFQDNDNKMIQIESTL